MTTLRRYAKAVAALLGALVTWATTYYAGTPNVAKWLGLALAVATFASVYQVPNDPAPGGESGHADVNVFVWVLATAVISTLVTVVVIAVWHVPHS